MSKVVFFCLLALLPSLYAHDYYYEMPRVLRDSCTFDCMTDLYAAFCGTAKCVYGIETPEEFDAMCSDKCLGVLFGKAAFQCLEANLPQGSDIYDFHEFLMGEISGKALALFAPPECIVAEFCYNGGSPPDSALSSQEAEMFADYEAQALDLVDADI